MDEPVRWKDDPDAPSALREDLRRVRGPVPPIDRGPGYARMMARRPSC